MSDEIKEAYRKLYRIHKDICSERDALRTENEKLKERDEPTNLYYRKFALDFINFKQRCQEIKLMQRFEQVGEIACKATELNDEVQRLNRRLMDIGAAAEVVIERFKSDSLRVGDMLILEIVLMEEPK